MKTTYTKYSTSVDWDWIIRMSSGSNDSSSPCDERDLMHSLGCLH